MRHPTVLQSVCVATSLLCLVWQLQIASKLQRWHEWDLEHSGLDATASLEREHMHQSGAYLPAIAGSVANFRDASRFSPTISWIDRFRATRKAEPRSRIAKVTSIFYDKNTPMTQTYELALLGHRQHNKIWGYDHYIQRRGDLASWSKLSYLLHVVVEEMEKPPAQRLGWLFWHDADVVLMNELIPLEAFLPPVAEKWFHVNFIVARDFNGLNAGAFFLRVCDWTIYLLAAGLSYRHFRPYQSLRFDEQSALELLTHEDQFRTGTMHVPQFYFNAYQPATQSASDFEESVPADHFVPGDLLVHFPGTKPDRRTHQMQHCLKQRMEERTMYNLPYADTRTYLNVTNFWEKLADGEEERVASTAVHLVCKPEQWHPPVPTPDLEQ